MERAAPDCPCVKFPFSLDPTIPPRIAILGACAFVTKNEFAGYAKEDLKIGSSLNQASLEYLSALNMHPVPLIVSNFLLREHAGLVPYCISTKPPIGNGPDANMWTVSRACDATNSTGSTPRCSSTRRRCTATPWRGSSPDGRDFVVMPEEHGIVEEIKRDMPSLVSGVRFYTSGAGDRCDSSASLAAAFFEAKRRLFDPARNPNLRRERDIRKDSFYVGYKVPLEAWLDKYEAHRARYDPKGEGLLSERQREAHGFDPRTHPLVLAVAAVRGRILRAPGHVEPVLAGRHDLLRRRLLAARRDAALDRPRGVPAARDHGAQAARVHHQEQGAPDRDQALFRERFRRRCYTVTDSMNRAATYRDSPLANSSMSPLSTR